MSIPQTSSLSPNIVMNTTRVQALKDERDYYLREKINFNNQYSALNQYFYQQNNDYNPYTPQVLQGDFKNDGAINDNVGMKSAKAMASAIMGLIWKNNAGTFRITPSKNLNETKPVIHYFRRINVDTASYFERPKSRFTVSLFQTILELVVYGTAGLITQSGGYSAPLKFSNKSILSFYVGYNKDGEIDTVFIDYNMSAKELYLKYGERAGDTVRSAVTSQDYTKRFVVTEAIKPRLMSKAERGKLAMPYSSEIFMPNEQVFLDEGGYESLPIKIFFFNKLEYESYGRSPAMEALPTICQINICTEILAVGGELTAQPSLGLYDNGSLAGLTVDFSAGALNVFNVAGTIPTERPVFPLFTVGDLRVIAEWLTILKQEIKEYFLLDKLYDLNAKQRKTLGEAMILDAIRSDSLTPIFSQILAGLEESLTRAIDILFGMGLLGVPDPGNTKDPLVNTLYLNGITPFKIPDEVLALQMNGLDWYDIKFINPASRIMNNEELQSTLKFIEIMGQAGAISPEFLDVIDPDGTAAKIKDLTATDAIVTRSVDDRNKIRQMRMEMQAEMARVEAQLKIASANQMNAQAAASQSNAVQAMSDIPTV